MFLNIAYRFVAHCSNNVYDNHLCYIWNQSNVEYEQGKVLFPVHCK